MAIWTGCNYFHVELPPRDPGPPSHRSPNSRKQSNRQTRYKGSSCSRVVPQNAVLLWASQVRCWFCMCRWSSLWGNYQDWCVQVHLIHRFLFCRKSPFRHHKGKGKTRRLGIWLESHGLWCLRPRLCRLDLRSRCVCNERIKVLLPINPIRPRELVNINNFNHLIFS